MVSIFEPKGSLHKMGSLKNAFDVPALAPAISFLYAWRKQERPGMAKTTAKIRIPHARKLRVTKDGLRKFLHVETDLPYYPSTPGYNGPALAEMRKAAEVLTDYADYIIHAPDKP